MNTAPAAIGSDGVIASSGGLWLKLAGLRATETPVTVSECRSRLKASSGLEVVAVIVIVPVIGRGAMLPSCRSTSSSSV